MGYASALSVVALIIMVIISYLLMRWLRPQT
jgi:ABC-type sugar transport system permease subunit